MLQSLGTGLSSFSINQVPYNLLRRGYEGETLDLCKNNGIGYIAHSPAAQGLLAGRVNKEARETPARKDNRLYQEPYFTHALGFLKSLEAMAEEIKRKPIELALAWAIAQENILTVAVGSRKFSHVPLIAKASDLILDKETLNRLTSLSDSFPQVKQGRRNPP